MNNIFYNYFNVSVVS